MPGTISQALPSIRVRHAGAGLDADAGLDAGAGMYAGAGLDAPDRSAANRILTGYRDHLARAGDPKAEPRHAVAATPDDLRAMPATLDRTTAAGRHDATLLLPGFRLGAREAELLAVDIGHVTHRQGNAADS